MTKIYTSELISRVADENGVSFEEARVIINSFVEQMVLELGSLNEVVINRFGRFTPRILEPREFHSNIEGGKIRKIERRAKVRFSESKKLYNTMQDLVFKGNDDEVELNEQEYINKRINNE